MKAPLPPDEEARLHDLRSYAVLDTSPEFAYDEITSLAAEICGAPISLITLVDEHRQWFKSKVGLGLSETDREVAFCAHAILDPTDGLVVPDALNDKRFADNPLVTGELGLRFYAGVPLVTPDGHAIGTLCVLDVLPRQLTSLQQRTLRLLASEVTAHLTLRRSLAESKAANLMLHALSEAQAGFLVEGDPSATFPSLLDVLLEVTGSEYGFIGEVLTDETNAPYVRVLGHAITDISWDDATRALYREHQERGMEFHNLRTLFGAALTSKQVVIANDPAHDSRAGGLPNGHPDLAAFLGLPIVVDGQVVGLAGIANRAGGYDEGLVRLLDPFIATCGTLITAQRENARRRAAEERLQAQNARLRELDVLKDELLANISHELRTPLTSILSMAELLCDDTELAERRAQPLAIIDRSARRLLDLVADLLLFASLESNALTLTRKPTDLGELAGLAVDTMMARAASRGLEVEFRAEPGIVADVDPRRLSQVVDNLLSNAVKFARTGGTVRVTVGVMGDRASIEVADDGLGIPADEVAGLFERFVRATNATRQAVPGTGVGLAIVKKLTELHGGDVSVESAEGHGATFRVRVPLRVPPASNSTGFGSDGVPSPRRELRSSR